MRSYALLNGSDELAEYLEDTTLEPVLAQTSKEALHHVHPGGSVVIVSKHRRHLSPPLAHYCDRTGFFDINLPLAP